MRSMFIVSVLSLSVALSMSACGGGGEEAYDTFQDCFDDHNQVEALPVDESIVICCLEHPINGVTEVSGAGIKHLDKYSFDAAVTKGNIENFTGVAQVPLGFAGPWP